MKITSQMVKELRDKTSAGMMDCKKALSETDGDMEKAVDLLRKKGLAVAAKRAGRATSEGVVETYIHAGGKLGVMIELNCETDFVAKNDDFKAFARNVAMHIAATGPVGIKEEDVPERTRTSSAEALVERRVRGSRGEPEVPRATLGIHSQGHGDGFEQSGLAAAVGPDQAHY